MREHKINIVQYMHVSCVNQAGQDGSEDAENAAGETNCGESQVIGNRSEEEFGYRDALLYYTYKTQQMY